MNSRISNYLMIAAALLLISPFAGAQCVDSLKDAVKSYQDAMAARATLPATAMAEEIKHAEEEVTADSNLLHAKLSFERNTPCLVAAILSNPAFIQPLVARVKAAFQQNSAPGASAGSTSIVSKGAAAKVLSVATDYGALTESVSGQTVTLSGSLAGVTTLIEKLNAAEPCTPVSSTHCISPGLENGLGRFSYSVAFDASQAAPQVSANTTSSTSTQPTTFTANYHSINAVTFKAVLLQGASGQPAAITQAVNKIAADSSIRKNLTAAALAQNTLRDDFDKSDEWKKWQADELEILKVASPAKVAAEYANWAVSIPQTFCAGTLAGCKLQQDATAYAEAYTDFIQAQNAFVNGLRAAPMITAEYDANLPTSQPSNSTFRLIAASPVFHPGLTITANGAVSFYNGNPSTTIPGARQLRDFQLAAETAYTFGSGAKSVLGQSTASLAYYYQDQTSPGILNVTPGQPVSGITFTGLSSTATQIFAKRGVINLMQMKFNYIPGKGSINVPISVTWSNRTELVTQPVWRAQVGVSYDFDSLLSLIGK